MGPFWTCSYFRLDEFRVVNRELKIRTFSPSPKHRKFNITQFIPRLKGSGRVPLKSPTRLGKIHLSSSEISVGLCLNRGEVSVSRSD